jgi:hypothetical protein
VRAASLLFVCVLVFWVVGIASAQVPPIVRPYDGIQAGLDAFRLAEEQRQAAVAVQLNQNEAQRAWAGLPSARGSVIYYGYPLAAQLADRDFAYAYGSSRFGRGYGVARYSVFEPWPLVPGDIYGGVYVAPLRQPIGQWQGQTGPRRWESHPIYDPPLADYRPLPEVGLPLSGAQLPVAPLPAAPAPPEVMPPEVIVPSPPAVPRTGPREF